MIIMRAPSVKVGKNIIFGNSNYACPKCQDKGNIEISANSKNFSQITKLPILSGFRKPKIRSFKIRATVKSIFSPIFGLTLLSV